MTEYIARNKVLAKAAPVEGCFSDMVSVYDVAAIPAADVVEVKHGTWNYLDMNIKYNTHVVECSECGAFLNISILDWGIYSNYCPNCGARMRGAEDE